MTRPPIIDACVSYYGEPERTPLLARLLSIPTEFRVAILSAILLAEVVVAVVL